MDRKAEFTGLDPELSAEHREIQRGYRLKYRGTEFTSLGEQCLPRALTSRWGFKATKAMGELSVPFDLAVHRTESVVRLLESDFAGYLDGLEYNETSKRVRNVNTGVMFNHERGEEFGADDCQLIRDIYARRIQNFRTIIDQPMPMVFVWCNGKGRPGIMPALTRLAAKIAKMRDGKPTALVAYQLFPHGTPRPDFQDISTPELPVMHVYRNYPYEGYVWHEPWHCFSPEGFAFEKALATSTDEALSDRLDWEFGAQSSVPQHA